MQTAKIKVHVRDIAGKDVALEGMRDHDDEKEFVILRLEAEGWHTEICVRRGEFSRMVAVPGAAIDCVLTTKRSNNDRPESE
jgi:hypothetical protein